MPQVPCDQVDDQIRLARERLVQHGPATAGAARSVRLAALIRLAALLFNRFNCTRKSADLDEAIALVRAGVPLAPRAHPDRSAAETVLATMLLNRLGPDDI